MDTCVHCVHLRPNGTQSTDDTEGNGNILIGILLREYKQNEWIKQRTVSEIVKKITYLKWDFCSSHVDRSTDSRRTVRILVGELGK